MTISSVTRKTAIKRTEDSYRGGPAVPEIGYRDLELHSHFPIDQPMAKPGEWEMVRSFAEELKAFPDLGEVVEIGNPSGELKCVFKLKAHTVVHEDFILTNVFLRMKAFLGSSELVQKGLGAKKPYWKAVKAGTFVADSGDFAGNALSPSESGE